MNFVATVNVSLKTSILDPQGRTVERSLHNLGYDTVRGVRVGKRFRIDMTGDLADVERQLAAFASEVLTNPVIESVDWDLTEVTG